MQREESTKRRLIWSTLTPWKQHRKERLPLNIPYHDMKVKILENVELINFENCLSLQGKTSKLQVALDEIRNEGIVGLEYILDVQSDASYYHCVLCNHRFSRGHRAQRESRESSVIDHLTAYKHRLNYLVCVFEESVRNN